MKKRVVSLMLVVALAVTSLVGCGNNVANTEENVTTNVMEETEEEEVVEAEQGSVYYLNFKPEVEDIWQEIAASYTAETGIEVVVTTAAGGTYESTLKAEMAKNDAPTLFQINGPVGYQSWKDYCMDLSGTDLYSWLLDPSLAVTEGEGVYGIPYVVEGYGIIYNEGIMNAYFALENKATDVTSMDDINNFEILKAVVEDMQANKEALEIEGVFASTSFASGEDWRWQTHLANLPIYYEFAEKGISDAAEIDFSYAENFKNIFDLYLQNSTVPATLVGSKTVNDSMAEFALGQCAMVQNGNWGWGQISGVDGNVVTEDQVKFLPIYTGVEGEEKQGLCTGTENFFCVNEKASDADKAATIAFVEWLFSSDMGKDYVTNSLGFIAPFNTFAADETPTDPLAKEIIAYMANSSLTSVAWNFTAFPSQEFKNAFGGDLLQYAQDKISWDDVETNVVESWASEKALAATAE